MTQYSWGRAIEVVVLALGGAALLAMMLLISLDVFFRAIFRTGVLLTPELVSLYFMVAVAFIPTALAELYRRHIVASVLIDRFSVRIQGWVIYISDIASFLLYSLMTYLTASEAGRRTANGTYVESGTIQFASWPSYWILPASFALMALVLVMRIMAGPSRAGPIESSFGASQ